MKKSIVKLCTVITTVTILGGTLAACSSNSSGNQSKTAADSVTSPSENNKTENEKWTPVKSIDFSSKHNVMIKNSDGSLTPMDEPYFKSTQIAPGTWQILTDGDYIYLVEGDNEALVIDTGYGAGNIREYC